MSEPPHRHSAQIPGLAFATLRTVRPKELCFGGAWCNGIRGNAVGCELYWHTACDTFQRCLCRGVAYAKREAARDKAGDVNDATEFCGAHPRQQRLGELQCRTHVQIHDRCECIRIDGPHGLMPGKTYIIDNTQYVSASDQVIGDSQFAGELLATPITDHPPPGYQP